MNAEPGGAGTPVVLGDRRPFGFLSRWRGWRTRLLPHEYAFSLFLALTWARLVLRPGPAPLAAFVYFGCLLTSAAVILWSGSEPAPWRWRIRLLLYPAMMGLTFYLMPTVVASLEVPRADALMVKWERAWLGQNINLAIQGWEPAWFTDTLMVAYVFFFYYLIAGPAYYCIKDLLRFRQCFAGLFVIYALGFIGYTFLPAGGPHRFLEFDRSLTGGWVTGVAKPILDAASNRVDAFPSIHVAVSFYLLVFDHWYYRRRFWRLLIPCVALWVSTVYLRYHYCVDVVAGFAIAAIGLWVAARYERSNLASRVPLQPVSTVPTGSNEPAPRGHKRVLDGQVTGDGIGQTGNIQRSSLGKTKLVRRNSSHSGGCSAMVL